MPPRARRSSSTPGATPRKPIGTTPNHPARLRAFAPAIQAARTGTADHVAVTAAVLAYIVSDQEAADEVTRLGAYQLARDAFADMRQAAMRGSQANSQSAVPTNLAAVRAAQLKGIERAAGNPNRSLDPMDWPLPGTAVQLRNATAKDLARSERLCARESAAYGVQAAFLGAVASHLASHKKARCVGECLDAAGARAMATAAGMRF